MQTLVFNTLTKTAKLYLNKAQDSEILYEFTNVPTVKVEDGWVTLEGDLPWNFEKEAAKKAVNNLAGVKGVTNNIKIKSEFVKI